jgi:UDP-glucose 4-epimerase
MRYFADKTAMTILITGSSGHLGEALMRRLRADGAGARGLDIKPSPFTDCVGSICDRAAVRAALAGARAVIHTATLHKPHVATHSDQDFIDTNITGTLILLEEAMKAGVAAFIFTSTTSTFGAALTPPVTEPAAWITEDVAPVAKNIYGVTKLAAEDLCALFARRHRLPVLVLRTSRFFPEDDDNPQTRARYSTPNAQANELLYRRVDIADVVSAHLCALVRAATQPFGRYIVSATTPFAQSDLPALRTRAAEVVERLFPGTQALFAARGWTLFPEIDRVYANARARNDLAWAPVYDFAHVLGSLREARDFRSPLAREIGAKGYHDRDFESGPYPVMA